MQVCVFIRQPHVQPINANVLVCQLLRTRTKTDRGPNGRGWEGKPSSGSVSCFCGQFLTSYRNQKQNQNQQLNLYQTKNYCHNQKHNLLKFRHVHKTHHAFLKKNSQKTTKQQHQLYPKWTISQSGAGDLSPRNPPAPSPHHPCPFNFDRSGIFPKQITFNSAVL